ncbi:MAG TPA: DUF2723 domain-containing protein [bacterium]|nr:DUF2723 domain-containing protein [bacterium]HPN43669.1 DUF2723 domain-containing protein [bacterium]
MQHEKLINRICAGVAFIFSLIIYLKTIAPTVSFWDCGEFITCSYILGIPHPPGAPFYLLLGRIFSMLPLAADIGLRVNIVSALSSAVTVMLTYLIIVRFIKQWRGEPKNTEDIFVLAASGLIGALAFAFTDTFWFNAVEAEVYAISMFFTAIIVWLIMIWLEKAESGGSERYVLIIAYLTGLAIGVHLLLILALPAVFMIVYFKYLEQNNLKITLANLAAFALITLLIFAAIYPGVVQWIPRMAGAFSLWSLLILVVVITLGTYYAIAYKRRILSLALMSLMLVLMGYSTYTMIYIRSGLDPVIDENDPETTKQMVSYLNREQYGTWSTFPRRFPGIPQEWEFNQLKEYGRIPKGESYTWYKFDKQMDFMWNYQIKKMYLRYFTWQFAGKGTTLGADGFIVENFSLNGLMGLPLFLGLIGMVHHYYRNWRHALSLTAFLILTGIAIVIYLNQEDPQPRERDYVFVGSFFAFSVWIGMGVTAIIEMIQDAMRGKAQLRFMLSIATAILLFVAVPLNLFARNYNEHDRTGDYVAYDYSYNILQTCDDNGILFTNGDNDTFPLWFLQYVYGIKKDVRVVNLSLLNTSWYIKQLKDQEPIVPISLPDSKIDALEVMAWKEQKISIPVPPDVRQRLFTDLGEVKEFMPTENNVPEEISFVVKPTIYGQGIRVQDYMILNILYANRWEKPVYFAVTVSNQNKLDMDEYLRMDGLCFEVTPVVDDDVMAKKLHKNLFENFQFRGLNDPDVYLNDNIKGLLQNYRAAFLRLADYYRRQQKNDLMVSVLDRMETVMPDSLIPPPDVRLPIQIGSLYDLAGQPEKFIKKAEWAVKVEPDNAYAVGTLVSLYEREGINDKAITLLENWLIAHPDDSEAKTKLEEMKKLAGMTDAATDTNNVKK